MKLKIEKRKVEINWLKPINEVNDYLSFLVNAFEGMHIHTTNKDENEKQTQLKALSQKRFFAYKLNYDSIIDEYILPQNSEEIYKIQKKGSSLGQIIQRDMKIHKGEMYQINKNKKDVKIFGQPNSYIIEQYKDKKETKKWLEKQEQVYPFRTVFGFTNKKQIQVYFQNSMKMNMVANFFICQKILQYKKVLTYLSNQFTIKLSICLFEQIGLYQIKINPNFQRKQMLQPDDILQDPFRVYNSLIFNFDRYALNHLMQIWDRKSQLRIIDKNAYNLHLQTDNSPKVGQLSHIVEVNNEISFKEQKKNLIKYIETFINYDKQWIKQYIQIWQIKSHGEHLIEEKKNFSIIIQINELIIDSNTYMIQPQISIKMSEKIKIHKEKQNDKDNNELNEEDEDDDDHQSIDCEEYYQMATFNTTGKQFNAEVKRKQQKFFVYDLAPSQLLFKEQENMIIFQNVDVNQQILMDLTDKSQIIDNKYKQIHKIHIRDILDQNFTNKVLLVSLKEKQAKLNLTEKLPLINKPSYLNIQIQFQKKQDEKEKKLNFPKQNQQSAFNTVNDPYYIDKIILPEISMETLPIMLEYMKEKDEHYFDIIDNIAFYFNSAFNHTLAKKIQDDLIKQINFQIQILHSDISEQLDLNKQMQKELENIQVNQDQNMVFLNQLIRSIFINDYRQSQNIKEILKKYSQVGFSHNFRQILWYNLFNIPSQFTDERTFLQELNLYKDDYLLAEKPETVRLYFSISDAMTSINKENETRLMDILERQESYKCLTTLLKSQVEKLLMNFLKWTELKQINQTFIKQTLVFTVRIGLKIVSMNNYFYICKKQKKFYDETQSFIMSSESDDVSTKEENALNFWFLINILKIIKGFDENQYMEQLQKTCLFMKLFMKQICPNILEKIQDLYYQPEYFFNHIFRDLFSSILSSEYLYRIWDYMIFNYAVEQQQIPFFLCSVLLTILHRMQKKIQMIIDIVDFAHILRMETILIGNTKIFHAEIQENLKKIKLFFSQDKNLIQYIEGQIKNLSLFDLDILNFNILDPQEQNMIQQAKSIELNPFQKIKQQELSFDQDENKKKDENKQKKLPEEQKNTFMDYVNKATKELGLQNTQQLPEDELFDDLILYGSPQTKLNKKIDLNQKKNKFQKLFQEKKLVQNLQTVQIREQQILQNRVVQLIDSQNSSFTLSLQQLLKQYNFISIHDHHIDQLRNINQPDYSNKLYHLITQSYQKFNLAEKLIAFLIEQRRFFLEVVKSLQELIILEVDDMKFINIKTDTKLIEDFDLGKQQAQLQQDLHIYQSFFLKCYTSINNFKNEIEYNDEWKNKVENISIVKNQEFNKFSLGQIQNVQQQLFSLKEIINSCQNYKDDQTNQILFEQYQLKSIFEKLQKQNIFFNNSQTIFKCLFHSFTDDIASILKICQENHHQYFIVSNDFKRCADEVKNMSKIRDHRIVQLEFEVIKIKSQFLNFKFPYNRIFNSEIISQCGIQLKHLKNQHDEQVLEIVNYTKDQSSFFFELRKIIGKRQQKKLREVQLEIKLLQTVLSKVIEVEKYEKNLERLIFQRQYFQEEQIVLDDFDKKIFFFSEQLEIISLDKEQVKGFLYFLPQLRNFHQRMENEHMYCKSYMELLDDYFQTSTDIFDQEKLVQLNKLIESAQEFQNLCIQDLKKLMQTVHWFQKNLETVDDFLTQLCIYKVLRKQPISQILKTKKIYDELKELKEGIAEKLNKLLSQKLLTSKYRQEIVQSMNITTKNPQIYQFISDLKLVIQINQQVKYDKNKQEILTDVQLICDYIIILKNNIEMFIDLYKDKNKTGKKLKEELDQIICDLDMKIFSFDQRQFFQDLEISIENYKKRTLQVFDQRVNQKKIKAKQEKVEINHELIDASEQNMHKLQQAYFQCDEVMTILSNDYNQINVLIPQIRKLNEYVQDSQPAYTALVKVQMHIADQDIKQSIENMIILEEIVKNIKNVQDFADLIEKLQDGFLNANVNILSTAQMIDQINSQKDKLLIEPVISQKIPEEFQNIIKQLFIYTRTFIANINTIWSNYVKILQKLEIHKAKIPVKKVELFNIKFCQMYDDYVNFILISINQIQAFSNQFSQKDEFINKWMKNLNFYIITQKEQISGNLSDQSLTQLRDNLISLTDYQLSEITKNTVDLMSKLHSPVAKDILFGEIKTLINNVYDKIIKLKTNIFVDKIPDEINQNLLEIVNKQQLQERLEKIHVKGWLYVCEIFNEFYKVVQNQSLVDSNKEIIITLQKQLIDEQSLYDATIQSVIDDIIKLFKKITK